MRIPLMTIPRFTFGISGLDEMLSGGLIEGTVSTIIGSYGTERQILLYITYGRVLLRVKIQYI